MRTPLLLVALLALFLHSNLHAQEAPKREVGIQFYGINFDGFNGFDAFYKKQIRENVYRRYRLLTGNINSNFRQDNWNFSFLVGGAIGREKRKALGDKLQAYSGPEFGIRFLMLSTATNGSGFNQYQINPSFGYVLGLQHRFNERWALNLEAVPSAGLTFSYSSATEQGELNVNAGFSSSVSLGIVRMF